jgi:hypothetical protein
MQLVGKETSPECQHKNPKSPLSAANVERKKTRNFIHCGKLAEWVK